jgi:hypothetical protein
MRMAPTRLTLKRLGGRIGLAALFVLALFSLSQCRMVNDRLVGVDVGLLRQTPAKCMDKCRKEAEKELKVEERVHLTYVRACNGNATCLASEDTRHQAAVQGIEDRRQECASNCHSQGGGGDD